MTRADEHRITVDHFEGAVAVVEIDGLMLDLPRWVLPNDAKEGSILVGTLSGSAGEASINLRIDAAATEAARAEAEAALSKLRLSDPGGDLVL